MEEELKLPELPEIPYLPPSKSAEERILREWATAYGVECARQAVLAERQKLAELLDKCAEIAEWHIGDGDGCGVLAREVYAAIRKG